MAQSGEHRYPSGSGWSPERPFDENQGGEQRFDGERGARDFGRGQRERRDQDEYRPRGYGYGSGYGGYGQAPGEAGGSFDSARSYSAEPGWGPGYGEGDPHRGAGSRYYAEQDSLSGSHGARAAAVRREWRGPKGYRRSDERIREDICERLMASGHVIDAREVSVEVKDAKVTLSGTVPERRMKHAIEDVVDACMGVEDIDNRIRVDRGWQGDPQAQRSGATHGELSIGSGPGSPSQVSGMSPGAGAGEK